jgi:hypothetical protein
MLSFPGLGRQGRLGNQMFQFAATFSIAETLGYGAIFPSQHHDLHCFEIDFDHLFTDKQISPAFTYVEDSVDFNFDSRLFSLPDNCALQGYFQSLGYISPQESKIKRMLSFKREIKDKAFEKFRHLGVESSKKISVHVRRGDYLNIPDILPVCDVSYYREAVGLVRSKLPDATIVVFSDDIQWCSENLKFDNCVFTGASDHRVDMCMMTMCDAQVIANSSFSWWASYLNNSNHTVAPANWFGHVVDFDPTDYLYRKEWRVA